MRSFFPLQRRHSDWEKDHDCSYENSELPTKFTLLKTAQVSNTVPFIFLFIRIARSLICFIVAFLYRMREWDNENQ